MSFRGGGRGFYGRGRGYPQRGGSAPNKGGMSGLSGPVVQRAMNPLNQYYIDKFLKLKKDADSKGMRNQAFCYKRVLAALGKYPMPILCVDQA